MRQWRHTPRVLDQTENEQNGTKNAVERQTRLTLCPTDIDIDHKIWLQIWLQPWPFCLQNHWWWISTLNTALKFNSTNRVTFWLSPAGKKSDVISDVCLLFLSRDALARAHLLTYYVGVCDIILWWDKSETTENIEIFTISLVVKGCRCPHLFVNWKYNNAFALWAVAGWW